jgi:hypothetical protein
MEEILASIRQIISEDGEGSEAPDAKGGQGLQASSAAEDASAEQEPEEIASPAAEAHAEPEPQSEPEPERKSAPAQGEPMTPHSSGRAAEIDQPFEAPIQRREAPSAARSQGSASDDGGQLLSAESGNAVHGAFSALAHTILAQNARTLEDLVTEMLQPMLHSWLDDNLPALVERLVQEEIRRVSRGGR